MLEALLLLLTPAPHVPRARCPRVGTLAPSPGHPAAATRVLGGAGTGGGAARRCALQPVPAAAARGDGAGRCRSRARRGPRGAAHGAHGPPQPVAGRHGWKICSVGLARLHGFGLAAFSPDQRSSKHKSINSTAAGGVRKFTSSYVAASVSCAVVARMNHQPVQLNYSVQTHAREGPMEGIRCG